MICRLGLSLGAIVVPFLNYSAMAACPASHPYASSTSYATTVSTPLASGTSAWSNTGISSPVTIFDQNSIGVWQRAVSSTTSTVTTTVSECYTSAWSQFWGGIGVSHTETVSAPVIGVSVKTETAFCANNVSPPPATLPPPSEDTSVSAAALPSPAIGVPVQAFAAAGQTMAFPTLNPASATFASIVPQSGTAFILGGTDIGALASQVAALDDPAGQRALFSADFQAVGTALDQVGLAMQSAVIGSSSPFSTLANQLRALATDLRSQTLSPPDYVGAATQFVLAAGALDDAVGQLATDLYNGGGKQASRTLFLADLAAVGSDLSGFANQAASAAVPEPMPLLTFVMGASLLMFHHRGLRP